MTQHWWNDLTQEERELLCKAVQHNLPGIGMGNLMFMRVLELGYCLHQYRISSDELNFQRCKALGHKLYDLYEKRLSST